jgi:outer membrane protein assembly factor BamA
LNPELTPGNSTYNYLSLDYTYKQDFRDSKQYPLNGYYFDVGFEKTGFGILSDEINFWSAAFTFDQYFPLYKRLYFAYNLTARYTNGDGQPYFLTSGLGTNGLYIRGYELFVIPGQQFLVFKSNVKYQIIKPTDINIKWIKTQKFSKLFVALYSNIFFDVGYASDKLYYLENSFTNQLLWGAGFGLDLVSY